MFFEKPESLQVLQNFIDSRIRSDKQFEGRSFEQQLIDDTAHIVGYIVKSPKKFDDVCKFNISFIGKSFLKHLNYYPQENKGFERLYLMALRFFIEYTSLAREELEGDVSSIVENAFRLRTSKDLMGSNQSHLRYTLFSMPVKALNYKLEFEKSQHFAFLEEKRNDLMLELDEKSSLINTVISDWEEKIDSESQKVTALAEQLSQQKEAFNFVGLSDGFQRLKDSKILESRFQQVGMFWLFLLIFTPLVYSGWIVLNDATYTPSWFAVVSTASFIMLLIYFFKVLLAQYKSVKAEIIQIQLRQTLCQFIQSYAEYAKEIKSKDASALEKFENVIFSGITPSSDKIPSTFDGMDQITKLLKEIKK